MIFVLQVDTRASSLPTDLSNHGTRKNLLCVFHAIVGWRFVARLAIFCNGQAKDELLPKKAKTCFLNTLSRMQVVTV